MSLIVLGANHKSAKLAMRERWTYGPDEVSNTLQSLKLNLNLNDVALLSTCNRTEIYCDIDDPNKLINWFNQEIKPKTDLDITQHGYYYLDKSAVNHMMRVASGLDSLVVGEPQILGQFKQAYRVAKKANTVSKKFDRLFAQAISAAKDVRTYTEIGLHPRSVASLSVNLLINQLYQNNINNFNELKVLLIGSGDTIKTMSQTMIHKDFNNITIVSRNHLHAKDLINDLNNKLNINKINTKINNKDFDITTNIVELAEYDIICSATTNPAFMLFYQTVKNIINYKNNVNNNKSKLFLLDLAVPRDIDPQCNTIDQVCLSTIDDLQNVLQANSIEREKAIDYAENIIAQHINEFYNWEHSLVALASICSYRQQAEQMCAEIIEKAKRKLDSGQDPKEVLTGALELLRNKLLHHPTMTLKSLAQEQRLSDLPEVELLKDFLNL